MKIYLDYYPAKLAKKEDFARHSKKTDRFKDYCLGKNEWFYKDEGNYGYERNIKHLTDDEQLERAYLWSEFNLWSQWVKTGRNIFDFSKELLMLLKNTDVSQVELDYIKLPYPVFYLDISAAHIPFYDNCKALVEGVYISEYFNDMRDKDVTYERCITFDFVGDYISHFKTVNKNLYDHVRGFNSYYLSLDRPENQTRVEDAVKFAKDIFVIADALHDHDADTKIDLYKIHADFIERTIKLVVNCLLYLSMPDHDVKEVFPKDLPLNFQARLKKAKTKHQKDVVLNEIKLNGFTKIKYAGTGLKTYINAAVESGTISPHWRRGHWRNQKFGVGLKEQKLVWIMPTIVNSERGAPALGHIYQVEP